MLIYIKNNDKYRVKLDPILTNVPHIIYAGKDALKEAAKLIQSNLTDTIILFLIFIFSNFIGYLLLSIIRLPPIIGLLLTLPISMIVCILVVQNLTGEKPTWET